MNDVLMALMTNPPVTGDDFQAMPIFIVGGIAVVLMIVTTVLSKKKK
ncbi:MAG: hypothetical protein J6L05_03645 [Ruminococcus sp.]|nr:hypothetical protein [Ruminococcus sp.]